MPVSSSIPGPLRRWGLACLIGLAGCASAPPTVAISNAEIAIRKADTVGAAQHAPLELHVAREKLDSASQALEEGESEVARRLAEQALVDAELAEAKTRAAKARQNANEVAKTVDALRGEASPEPIPAAAVK